MAGDRTLEHFGVGFFSAHTRAGGGAGERGVVSSACYLQDDASMAGDNGNRPRGCWEERRKKKIESTICPIC